jgi:hypothetical protein
VASWRSCDHHTPASCRSCPRLLLPRSLLPLGICSDYRPALCLVSLSYASRRRSRAEGHVEEDVGVLLAATNPAPPPSLPIAPVVVSAEALSMRLVHQVTASHTKMPLPVLRPRHHHVTCPRSTAPAAIAR